ncbi:hypothetical protein ES703_72367 [subsurface metagenome]
MAEEPIVFKELYNKDRGLPEPLWGRKVEEAEIQCPTCGSTDMCYSGSPDDPEEIFGAAGNVRCRNCGRITDWFEALKQREHHPTDTPREVIRNGIIPVAPAVYCPKDGKEVPCWYCLGSLIQGREMCPFLARAEIQGGKTAKVECTWKE